MFNNIEIGRIMLTVLGVLLSKLINAEKYWNYFYYWVLKVSKLLILLNIRNIKIIKL